MNDDQITALLKWAVTFKRQALVSGDKKSVEEFLDSSLTLRTLTAGQPMPVPVQTWLNATFPDVECSCFSRKRLHKRCQLDWDQFKQAELGLAKYAKSLRH